jgi:TonB family protein
MKFSPTDNSGGAITVLEHAVPGGPQVVRATATSVHEPATATSALLQTALRSEAPEPTLTAIVTSVLWVGCVCIGVLGLSLSYGNPSAPKQAVLPVQAEMVNVELTHDPLLPPERASALPESPPELEPLVAPQLSSLLTVAEPSATIAFAVPVAVPARVDDPRLTSHTTPSTQAAAPQATPRNLTYGEGEGKQPAPDYPRQSIRRGQEGAVGIQFSVDASGRVLFAEAVSPSPWPLLNEAAVRAVRERWRFSPGSNQVYEVSIQFQLNKRPRTP